MAKTFTELLGRELTSLRKRAALSVAELAAKSGVSRQSIYDIEAGTQNVRAEVYERLILACKLKAPEDWFDGLDVERAPKRIPRRHQGLFHMLIAIVESEDDRLIEGIRASLDAFSDQALALKKKKEPAVIGTGKPPPVPQLREEDGGRESATGKSPQARKQKSHRQ